MGCSSSKSADTVPPTAPPTTSPTPTSAAPTSVEQTAASALKETAPVVDKSKEHTGTAASEDATNTEPAPATGLTSAVMQKVEAISKELSTGKSEEASKADESATTKTEEAVPVTKAEEASKADESATTKTEEAVPVTKAEEASKADESATTKAEEAIPVTKSEEAAPAAKPEELLAAASVLPAVANSEEPAVAQSDEPVTLKSVAPVVSSTEDAIKTEGSTKAEEPATSQTGVPETMYPPVFSAATATTEAASTNETQTLSEAPSASTTAPLAPEAAVIPDATVNTESSAPSTTAIAEESNSSAAPQYLYEANNQAKPIEILSGTVAILSPDLITSTDAAALNARLNNDIPNGFGSTTIEPAKVR